MREAEGNVALKVHETGEGDFEVAGRGELQLGVLIESMRREGFELSISRPRVLFKTENGEKLEPIEEVTVDVDDAYTGVVIEKISKRKGEMTDMRPTGAGKTRIVFHGPARGLIGYHGEFLTDTRGTGVMNRMFLDYAPHKGSVGGRTNGVLISTEQGEAVAYGLWYLEERGKLFVTPGTKVYEGMIIGQNAKDNDLDVNPLKSKQLTNIRTTSKDEAVRLTPIVPMTLEQAMAYIEDDELVEVTPQNIRLRKRELLPHLRKRAKQAAGRLTARAFCVPECVARAHAREAALRATLAARMTKIPRAACRAISLSRMLSGYYAVRSKDASMKPLSDMPILVFLSRRHRPGSVGRRHDPQIPVRTCRPGARRRCSWQARYCWRAMAPFSTWRRWNFGQVVGLYIATLFVVWQVINFMFFRTLPTLPILVGGALIVAGGLDRLFLEDAHDALTKN